MILRGDAPGERAAGFYSKSQMDDAIQAHLTAEKLEAVSNPRFIGMARIPSLEGGFGDFAQRHQGGDVPVASVEVVIFDQDKNFYFGDAEFFGEISDRGTFLPEDEVFLMIDHDCPISLVLMFSQACVQKTCVNICTLYAPS